MIRFLHRVLINIMNIIFKNDKIMSNKFSYQNHEEFSKSQVETQYNDKVDWYIYE
jgi:GTP-binding protein EngB required for normal cell division